SQVMVLGHPVAEADALSYPALKPRLAQTVLGCLAGLAGRFDAVICEGAGSPAEINLREYDIANMGLARAAGLPVIVVADIDRGGALAALYGTLALLSREDQALLAGFVVNKFRGDARLLEPGLDRLAKLTGRPVLGVLPWTAGLWLDAEDSLSLAAAPVQGAGEAGAGHPAGPDVLRVAVIRLPRISNFTDADPLIAEPGVAVRFVTSPAEITDADLVILPGSRATVADLAWLRDRRLAGAVTPPAARGGPRPGVRHLRRLPDARRGDPRRGGERRGPRPGAGPAARHGRVRPREGAPAAARNLGRRAGHRVRDPPRRGHRGRRRAVPRRVLRRGGAGHHVARHPRERRIPAGAAAQGRRRGRAVLRARSRRVRTAPGTAAGHPGRPGRRPPGHRRAAEPDRPRRARRAPVHPPGNAMSPEPLVLVSASDTDLLAARASGAPWRLANPARTAPDQVPGLVAGAYCVIVRLLGGRRSWPEGLAAVLAQGLPTVVLSGEAAPDADLMAASTVPAGVAAQALAYLREGGPANLAELA